MEFAPKNAPFVSVFSSTIFFIFLFPYGALWRFNGKPVYSACLSFCTLLYVHWTLIMSTSQVIYFSNRNKRICGITKIWISKGVRIDRAPTEIRQPSMKYWKCKYVMNSVPFCVCSMISAFIVNYYECFASFSFVWLCKGSMKGFVLAMLVCLCSFFCAWWRGVFSPIISVWSTSG